jgi:transposase
MRTRREYTQQFKDEAVRLVLQEKLSTPEAGRRLEISDKTLANWVRQARAGKRTSSVGAPAERRGNVSELEMEISKLRAEVARLKMEKEVLKKATAFFVKESQ